LFDRESNPFAGDDILAPYVAAQQRLLAAGLNVATADLLPESRSGHRKLIVSFGAPDRLVSHSVQRYERLARRDDVKMSAMFAMECPVVEPTMFASMPRLQQTFKRVFSWSDSESLLPFTHSPLSLHHFCWPQSFDAVHEQLWGRRGRKFLIMMNANKLPRLYYNELYTARLEAVEYFNRFGEIDLYGRNWDRMPTRVGKVRMPATFRRWWASTWPLRQKVAPDPLYVAAALACRGPAKSKSDTMANYRFALCFENSILKGWMTEKLFDCFFAGVVPVYWGAPDVLDWVPAECFIDMRKFNDYSELRAYLRQVTPAEESRYRAAARDYVASIQFDPFRVRSFVDAIANIVAEDLGMAPGSI
jgi:hypothetical protein